MNKKFVVVFAVLIVLFVFLGFQIIANLLRVGNNQIKTDVQVLKDAKQIEKNVLDLNKKNEEMFK